jgi:hypothetical protein
MDGSSFAPIIIPLVVTPVLAFWLIMVYYAAAHPVRKPERPAAGQPEAAPESAVRSSTAPEYWPSRTGRPGRPMRRRPPVPPEVAEARLSERD